LVKKFPQRTFDNPDLSADPNTLDFAGTNQVVGGIPPNAQNLRQVIDRQDYGQLV
jgi:hypothetical protein